MEQELSSLYVAAVLADTMVRKGQRQIVEETNVSLAHLLDMIELKREFNRRVLRYLGFKRKISYVRVRPGV